VMAPYDEAARGRGDSSRVRPPGSDVAARALGIASPARGLVIRRHHMATQAPAQGGACTILMRYDDRRGVRRGLPVTETGAPLDSEGEAPAVRSGALDEPARGQEATSPERYARPGEIYLPAGTRLS